MTSGKAQGEALAPDETVLAALLRHGLNPPHSCGRGTCLSCLLRAESGPVPEAAQAGLRATLRAQNYFLACQCIPTAPLAVASADTDNLYRPARVVAAEKPSPDVTRLFLEPSEPFDYRAGQFVNLRRVDGLTRSYSLASVPGFTCTRRCG
ncbi:MAG: 2Fe-2S iron-sulfur cluster binding domain-containing protein [Alphaproteobacteria bacterium]|nr:2Fe-2S iron-sulfur cluster binding domain-containing protein [Alphaproteobacteria bacterium]